MGGFRFNGCGVTDHFRKIKSLGTHICPNCGTLAEFTLDEVKQMIDVVFIPTFTLKSSYAVMCKKCKRGEACSVDWAGYLLNHDDTGEVFFESTAREKGWIPGGTIPATVPVCPAQQATQTAPVNSVQQTNNPIVSSQGKLCPVCGAKATPEMIFCTECGTKLKK